MFGVRNCCICGASYFGEGLKSQGMLLPVCGKPCFDRKVEEVSKLLESKEVDEPFHPERESPQGLVLAAVPA